MGRTGFLRMLLVLCILGAGCTAAAAPPTEGISFCGKLVDAQVHTLDLSWLTHGQMAEAVGTLPLLPQLKRVELASTLPEEDVLRLQTLFPQVEFHYRFLLFGQPVWTTDTAVELVNVPAPKDHERQLRRALLLMPDCRSLRLDNCGVDNEVMARIRNDYRHRTKVVWRVFFAQKGSCMTDRKIIRYVYNMDDTNCSALQYCEDAEYLDFGHNETLTDCSWVAGMPKLKAVILSGSLVHDLRPFAACKELEFLELAYCSQIKDLSPLRNCRKLQMVNTSFTGVTDLSPLDGARLERLCSVGSKVPQPEQARFQREHPDCLTLFTGKQPYGYCWRYEKDGYTPTPYYARLKEVFHYPDTHDTTW